MLVQFGRALLGIVENTVELESVELESQLVHLQYLHARHREITKHKWQSRHLHMTSCPSSSCALLGGNSFLQKPLLEDGRERVELDLCRSRAANAARRKLGLSNWPLLAIWTWQVDGTCEGNIYSSDVQRFP